MINIITFSAHNNPSSGGGVVAYCKALEKLFSNESKIRIKETKILPNNSLLGLKYNKSILKEYIKQSSPDIIHLNGYTSLLIHQIVPIARELGIKIVYTPHWHPFKTMRLPRLKEMYFYLFIKPYLKYMDAIVCINYEDYNFFKRFSNKIHLIPHWIESDDHYINNSEKIKDQILFVGSLIHPNKGFRYLNHLPENKYKIICVGRGDVQLRSDMTQLYRISNQELEVLYHQSSLVVIPSNYEAFSYVAMEALNAGTPVVMSERVRIADFLPDFEGIKIFNLASPDHFINAVDEMIGLKFDNRLIKEFFSAKTALQKYTQLYSSLLED